MIDKYKLYTQSYIGIKFLLNSYLDMNKDVDKLTEFVEGKIEKEKKTHQQRGRRNRQRGAELQRLAVNLAKEYELEAQQRQGWCLSSIRRYIN